MNNQYAIITTGISIYAKSNIFYKNKDKNILDEKHWEEIIEKEKSKGKVDLSKISAEINVLNSLKAAGEWEDLYSVTLVHSDTLDGLSAAIGIKTCVRKFFNVENCSITLKKVPGLDMNSNSGFLNSMIDLIEVLTKLFEEEYVDVKDKTLFIPIGGYKSVIMIAHLIGDLHGFTSWYQYEESNRVFAIPRLPVKVDIDDYKNEFLVQVITSLFCAANYTFGDTVSLNTFTEEELKIIKDNSYLFYPIGDEISISPMVVGKLKEIQNDTALYLPDIYIREKIDDKNNLKLFIKYFLRYWNRYANSPNKYLDTMHHENKIKNFPKNKKRGICRFTVDKRPFRGVYHISQDRKSVFFDKIWNDHDDYDRILNSLSIKKLFEEKIDFKNYKKIQQKNLTNLNLFNS